MSKDPLEQLRKSIDSLNKKIVDALNERAEVSMKIGKEKQRLDLAVLDEQRERQVIEQILKLNTGPISDDDIVSIFREIMRISRKMQQ